MAGGLGGEHVLLVLLGRIGLVLGGLSGGDRGLGGQGQVLGVLLLVEHLLEIGHRAEVGALVQDGVDVDRGGRPTAGGAGVLQGGGQQLLDPLALLGGDLLRAQVLIDREQVGVVLVLEVQDPVGGQGVGGGDRGDAQPRDGAGQVGEATSLGGGGLQAQQDDLGAEGLFLVGGAGLVEGGGVLLVEGAADVLGLAVELADQLVQVVDLADAAVADDLGQAVGDSDERDGDVLGPAGGGQLHGHGIEDLGGQLGVAVDAEGAQALEVEQDLGASVVLADGDQRGVGGSGQVGVDVDGAGGQRPDDAVVGLGHEGLGQLRGGHEVEGDLLGRDAHEEQLRQVLAVLVGPAGQPALDDVELLSLLGLGDHAQLGLQLRGLLLGHGDGLAGLTAAALELAAQADDAQQSGRGEGADAADGGPCGDLLRGSLLLVGGQIGGGRRGLRERAAGDGGGALLLGGGRGGCRRHGLAGQRVLRVLGRRGVRGGARGGGRLGGRRGRVVGRGGGFGRRRCGGGRRSGGGGRLGVRVGLRRGGCLLGGGRCRGGGAGAGGAVGQLHGPAGHDEVGIGEGLAVGLGRGAHLLGELAPPAALAQLVPGDAPERVSLLHGVGPLPRGGRGVLGGLALLGHGDGGGSGGGVLWGQGEGGAATAESEHGGDQRAGQGLLRAQRSAQVGGLDAADEADHLDHERVDEGGPEAPRDQGQHGAHQERAAEVDAGQGLLELGGAGDGVADQQDQGGGDADHQGGQGQQGRKAFEGAHGACLRSRG